MLAIAFINCNDRQVANNSKEMKTVDYVDLKKYMGDWYVIANIPTFIEKTLRMLIESYHLSDDGVIETTFFFRIA